MIKNQQISGPSLTKGELNELLGGWEGYKLGTVSRLRREDKPDAVWIELLPRTDRPKLCSGCREPVAAVHDRQERWIQDLPLFDTAVELLVHRCRLECSRCGPKLEHLSWLAPYQRVTQRLALTVARLCRRLPVKHVAEYFDLHWDTVKDIDNAHLESTLPEPDLSRAEVIAMDDFAVRKGHRFATMIIDPVRKEVLWVGQGRGLEELRLFFEQMGESGRAGLRAAVMDMWGPYELAVRQHCPNAEVVFDLFHVVSKYGREVIDQVRVDKANRLSADRPARKVVKGARWLLLRNAQNVSTAERIQLNELLAATARFGWSTRLKTISNAFGTFAPQPTRNNFGSSGFVVRAAAGLSPLKKFALALKKTSAASWHIAAGLHTSLLEGINNKIKVIKRMAYGFRDQEYFFLKIRQAFPGNPSRTKVFLRTKNLAFLRRRETRMNIG